MKRYNFSRMDRRIDLGNYGNSDKKNVNTGAFVKEFKPELTLWAGKLSMTLSQQLNLAGESITDEKIYVIRHNPDIEGMTYLKDGANTYRIDSVAFGDDFEKADYDTITCHKEDVKHG